MMTAMMSTNLSILPIVGNRLKNDIVKKQFSAYTGLITDF
jgi:hypothetical protein